MFPLSVQSFISVTKLSPFVVLISIGVERTKIPTPIGIKRPVEDTSDHGFRKRIPKYWKYCLNYK